MLKYLELTICFQISLSTNVYIDSTETVYCSRRSTFSRQSAPQGTRFLPSRITNSPVVGAILQTGVLYAERHVLNQRLERVGHPRRNLVRSSAIFGLGIKEKLRKEEENQRKN